MKNLLTKDGNEIKTYRELRVLENVSNDETGTIEYKAQFNGEDCTIYRHWSNADLGFYIYKGNNVSDCIAHILLENWFPYVDENGNRITEKYSDGSDSGAELFDCKLQFDSCEN